jgi:hypothetical protein
VTFAINSVHRPCRSAASGKWLIRNGCDQEAQRRSARRATFQSESRARLPMACMMAAFLTAGKLLTSES